MTKFGVTAFSEALRQGGAARRHPRHRRRAGYVETELQGHNTNPVVLHTMEKMRPIVRAAAGRDIAAIVYALATRTSTSRGARRAAGRSTLVRTTGAKSCVAGCRAWSDGRLHDPLVRTHAPRVPRRQPRADGY
jgi:hypothetical protein